MNAFFQTEPFSHALMEALDYVAHGGADVPECLSAAQAVREGDYESWHLAWADLAESVRRRAASDLAAGRTTAARHALLRAAHYYRVACRFVASGERDPRVLTTCRASETCLQTALRLSAPAYQTVTFAHAGTTRTGHLHRADGGERHRPTLLAIGGGGATSLELFFACAVPATRHGWHCLALAGSKEAEDGRQLAQALLTTATTLPSVDPTRLAVLAFCEEPAPRPGEGNRRLYQPLAAGSAELVAATLQRAAAPNPAFLDDIETTEHALPNGSTLSRFHQHLCRWLDGLN